MEYARKTPYYIKKWSKEHPDVAKTLHMLGQEGVRAAICCGTAAEIGKSNPVFDPSNSTLFNISCVISGQSSPTIEWRDWRSHEADDIDLVVHHDDFSRAAKLLGADVSHEDRCYETADGYNLEYNLSTARAKLGTKVLEICHTDDLMVAQKDAHKITYDWRITDFAVDNFIHFKTRQGVVPLAHYGETLLLYSILQRRPKPGKPSDAAKTTMAHASRPTYNTADYIVKRRAEMGVTEDYNRLWEFEQLILDSYAEDDHEMSIRSRGGVWREFWPGL